MNSAVRKKVLVVLCGDLFIRNYLTTDALVEVEGKCDCFYLASDTITIRAELEQKPGFLGYYHFDKDVEAEHYRIFDILMWRYRDKSSSFRFRTMRETRVPFRSARNGQGGMSAVANYVPRLVKSWIKKTRLVVLGSKFGFPVFAKRVIATLPVNDAIRRAITVLKPDVVIVPSSAYDPAGNDVARICTASGIPSLFLIDNWDNLSSKSIMWAKPDYLGVWGQQSVDHAVEIQGLARSRVTPIGTPRFDQYFRLRDTALPSHFPHPYALFVGTALEFDEVGALLVLDDYIQQNKHIFGDLRLVYRPHPWRQGRDSIIGKDVRNVIIDPQVAATYADRQTKRAVHPDLRYYPRLLNNADVVIGGLTSMIIEAQIFRKKFLALVYNDKSNLTSQHNALKYYVHFRGLQHLSAVEMCDDIALLPAQFLKCWQSRRAIDGVRTDREREFFLHDEPQPYKQRLHSLVETVVRASPTPRCKSM